MRPIRRAAAWLLAGAMLALGTVARAQVDSAGTSGADFLKLGAGARAGAMAEAQVGLADDTYAVYYNPAGLLNESHPMAAGMHDTYLQGLSYDFVGFSLPLGGGDGQPARHALGVSVYGLSANNIQQRTQDTDSPIGSVNASETAYALSYAYRATDNLRLGVTGKYVRSSLDVVTAGAFAADLGAQYKLGFSRPVELGVVLRNAGSQLSWQEGSDPLPLTYGAGAAAEVIKGVSLDLDVMRARDTNAWVEAGGEYKRALGGGFRGALRAGYSTHATQIDGFTGFTTGFGLGMGPVDLDFAWIPFGELGQTFRYSLEVRF
jgi:Type IX secretion system protein PorV